METEANDVVQVFLCFIAAGVAGFCAIITGDFCVTEFKDRMPRASSFIRSLFRRRPL